MKPSIFLGVIRRQQVAPHQLSWPAGSWQSQVAASNWDDVLMNLDCIYWTNK